MASSVSGTYGMGISDGEAIDSTETRWATVSMFDAVGGSSPLLSVPGIVPAGGNPLQVTQRSTPGMGVTVKAGRIFVPGNTGSVPAFGAVLPANTDLDIAAANVTNPRIDLVIAKAYSPGTSSADVFFEVVTGTPGAVPTRPALPSGDYHAVSIATVTVPANASSILNANIAVAQSDTWTSSTSDIGWTAAPGGCVVQAGLIAMGATRRAAWATRLAPYTPWYDPTAKVFGVTNGSDLVPMTPRVLYQVIGAATQQSSTTSGVTVANSGTLTVFGGNRRIRVTASGQMGTDRNDVAGWVAGRAYLSGSGAISGDLPSAYTQANIRVWGNSASASTVSQQWFSITNTFTVAAGTLSVALGVLQVAAGGSGTGSNAIVTNGCLLVEDIGPA